MRTVIKVTGVLEWVGLRCMRQKTHTSTYELRQTREKQVGVEKQSDTCYPDGRSCLERGTDSRGES